MAATEKKSGSSWFSGWFKPKALNDTIKNVTLSLDVDDQANPRITLKGEEGDIKSLIKSLKYEGIDIPEGHLKRSIVFHEEENIEQLVSALEKLRGGAKKMNLPKLKDRVNQEEMEGITPEDLVAIRQQYDPALSNLRSHLKLAVRDMEEAIAEKQKQKKATKKPGNDDRKKAEPDPTQADFILETQYTLDAANSPEGGVALRFPIDATQEQKRIDLVELRAEFGEEGKERVKMYRTSDTPPQHLLIIKGITPDDLGVAKGSTIGKTELVEQIRTVNAGVDQDIADNQMVIDLADVQHHADTTKRASFRFPDNLSSDRKESYLQELRDNFADGGRNNIKSRRSKLDKSLVGLTIVGLGKDDIMEAGQATINNKRLAEKVRAMASAVEVEPTALDVATEVVAAPSSAEQVTAFLKEFRNKMVRDSHNHEQELDKAAITFPKRSKVIRFAGIGPEAGDLRNVVEAFKAEGFNHTGIIAGNEIHIDLSGTDRSSRAAAVSGSSTPSSLEGKMETLLSTAFKAPEVTQLMAQYKRRNPPSQAAETAIG